MAQNSFYVQPADFIPGLNAMAEKAIVGGVEEKKRTDLADFAQKFETMSPVEIAQYTLEHPDISQQITQSTEMNLKMTKAENLQQAWDVIAGKKNPVEALKERAQTILDRGGDATDTIALMKDSLMDGEKAMKGAYAYVAANDPTGLTAYLKATGTGEAGKKTDKQKTQSFLVRDGEGKVSIATGVFDPNTGTVETATGPLPEGLEVVSPLGETAAEQTGRRVTESGEAAAAAAAAKTSSEYFDKAQEIRQGMSAFDEAIAAIDEGAQSGPIYSMLPSFRSATIKLDNLQKRLGLGVVATSKFGPLSEGELRLALQTGMPNNLQPPDLRKWLVDKRDAQDKLISWLESLSVQLDEPGMTKGKLLARLKEQEKELPEGVTEADIQHTMKLHGVTREEVLAKIKGAK